MKQKYFPQQNKRYHVTARYLLYYTCKIYIYMQVYIEVITQTVNFNVHFYNYNLSVPDIEHSSPLI